MPQSRRYLLISLGLVLLIVVAWLSLRSTAPVVPEAIQRGYSEALTAARSGQPGAARQLYQQLARPDLSVKRSVWLLAELPNYPSPQALKLADAHLQNEAPEVRLAAIQSIVGLVPGGQRSLLLGPMLDDEDQSVRFAAINALLGLTPDELGLYFAPLQQAIDGWEQVLKGQPESAATYAQLARLYLHNAELKQAQQALDNTLRLEPGNLQALVMQIDVLDRQGQSDAARQLLAKQLQAQPDSATCSTRWVCGCCITANANSPCSACPKPSNWSLTTRTSATTSPPPCTPPKNSKRRRNSCRKSYSATPPTARPGCC